MTQQKVPQIEGGMRAQHGLVHKLVSAMMVLVFGLFAIASCSPRAAPERTDLSLSDCIASFASGQRTIRVVEGSASLTETTLTNGPFGRPTVGVSVIVDGASVMDAKIEAVAQREVKATIRFGDAMHGAKLVEISSTDRKTLHLSIDGRPTNDITSTTKELHFVDDGSVPQVALDPAVEAAVQKLTNRWGGQRQACGQSAQSKLDGPSAKTTSIAPQNAYTYAEMSKDNDCQACLRTLCDYVTAEVVTSVVACAILALAFFPAGLICGVVEVVVALFLYEWCNDPSRCDDKCCPGRCDREGTATYCCGKLRSCLNELDSSCCPANSTPCQGRSCCDTNAGERCTDDGTCCGQGKDICQDGTCCPTGNCSPDGHCCSGHPVCADGSCCDVGACAGGHCCTQDKICGDACCNTQDKCLEQQCCSPDRACGERCCAKGTHCADASTGTCVANHCRKGTTLCSDGTQTMCCPIGSSCCGGACCPSTASACCGSPPSCKTMQECIR